MSKVTIEVDFLYDKRILDMYLGFKEEGDWISMEAVRATLKHMGVRIGGIPE